MKKTFFFILSGLVMGSGLVQADVSLLYSYDFETFVGTLESANTNLSSTPGTGAFINPYAGNTFVNWGGGALDSTRSYETKPGGGKLKLTGTGENGSLGVNTTDGFTLSFFFRDLGTVQNSTVFQLNATNGNISSWQDSPTSAAEKKCQFYNNGTNIANWAGFMTTSTEFVHVALTFQNGTLTGYANGNRFLQASDLNFSGELTSIDFGTLNSAHADFDNIQLYSGLLNQSEIAYLSTHKALPEPASATLGALGVALLSLRRKRKR